MKTQHLIPEDENQDFDFISKELQEEFNKVFLSIDDAIIKD